ncbi:hypothetical protein BDB00DRAFT_882298 [Zychaea mexicana]|uniref:uncharacterized protein n=1 Tax=Zychaea mexicana TaxID=64656 RepID=UPI0022FE45BE|nr:uncharacterized protein BDB00DRAFT_882298 [Zychaea mexicana]KAI9495854.1 hypothetical protein BDB00DRAFT_882298 [Zychaea mexicana]
MLGKDQVHPPLWNLKENQRPMALFIPDKTDWFQDSVSGLAPDMSKLILGDGKITVGYNYLVVAAVTPINRDQIKGLKESLGKDELISSYSPENVQKTYKFIQASKGGNSSLATYVCIVFLAEKAFRLQGIRHKSKIIYNSIQERNTTFNAKQELVEIRPNDRKAIFRNLTNPEQEELKACYYDFLHDITLADQADLYRHNKYKNVFFLGDCSKLPTGETIVAVTIESGKKIKKAEYDGYASCPFVVGRKELVLAEFSVQHNTGKLLETFPINQRRNPPTFNWNGLLTDRWKGPTAFPKSHGFLSFR